MVYSFIVQDSGTHLIGKFIKQGYPRQLQKPFISETGSSIYDYSINHYY